MQVVMVSEQVIFLTCSNVLREFLRGALCCLKFGTFGTVLDGVDLVDAAELECCCMYDVMQVLLHMQISHEDLHGHSRRYRSSHCYDSRLDILANPPRTPLYMCHDEKASPCSDLVSNRPPGLHT